MIVGHPIEASHGQETLVPLLVTRFHIQIIRYTFVQVRITLFSPEYKVTTVRHLIPKLPPKTVIWNLFKSAGTQHESLVDETEYEVSREENDHNDAEDCSTTERLLRFGRACRGMIVFEQIVAEFVLLRVLLT